MQRSEPRWAQPNPVSIHFHSNPRATGVSPVSGLRGPRCMRVGSWVDTNSYFAVHGQGQTKIHEILRVFDLYVSCEVVSSSASSPPPPLRSSEYGPCVGVTRIERWNRASALGLNPPIEVNSSHCSSEGSWPHLLACAQVRDILLTKEALADVQYSYSVFHDQV